MVLVCIRRSLRTRRATLSRRRRTRIFADRACCERDSDSVLNQWNSQWSEQGTGISSWPDCVVGCSTAYSHLLKLWFFSSIIYNADMVSQRAESEAQFLVHLAHSGVFSRCKCAHLKNSEKLLADRFLFKNHIHWTDICELWHLNYLGFWGCPPFWICHVVGHDVDQNAGWIFHTQSLVLAIVFTV